MSITVAQALRIGGLRQGLLLADGRQQKSVLMRHGAQPMNVETLRKDLFLLVGHLLTSAHGPYDEPKGYGPFRLLDAAGRLLATM